MNVRFGDFTLDSDRRQLIGAGGEVHLSVKAFDLLCLLLEHRPNVVPKSEIQARLWPDTHVVDANLAILIGDIRKALGDPAADPRLIRTVHRVGYAFAGDAVGADGDRRTAADRASRFWLTVDGRTAAIAPGETTIGRDPRCEIWLDAEGVSRRHARVHVAPDDDLVRLEDLDSTNGTFVGRTRVTGARLLNDGDVIRIGSATLTFRAWSGSLSAKTKRLK